MPPALTSSRQPLISAHSPTHSQRYHKSYLTSDEVKPNSTLCPSSHSITHTNYSTNKSIETTSKLSTHHHPSQHTMIIFDWDDTLLPSSYLGSRRCRLDSDFKHIPYGDRIKSALDQLDNVVSSLLKTATQYGKVHIITNAEQGWVQLSAAKFLPLTSSLLPSFVIESARTAHERSFPDAPLKWKMSSFAENIQNFLTSTSRSDMHTEKHIISLGDSQLERQAVRTTTRGYAQYKLHTKSIKLSENPSIEQLTRQMELVTQCFNYICTHNADLDLQMSVSAEPSSHYSHYDPFSSPLKHSNIPPPPPPSETIWQKDDPRDSYLTEDDDMDACGEIGAESGDDDNSMFDMYSSIQTFA
jgi:hypothetical protein